MAAMVTTVVLPMVSVDVSKRTEVTNNVRAASMRPKRRDRERRRCIIISFFFPVIFFLNWSIVEQSDGEDSNSNIHRVVRDFFFWFLNDRYNTHTHTYIYVCICNGCLETIGDWRRRWLSNVAQRKEHIEQIRERVQSVSGIQVKRWCVRILEKLAALYKVSLYT